MKIGSLNHRITLIGPVAGDDGMGGRPKEKENRYEVWADVRTFSNSAANQKQVFNTVASHEARLIYLRKLGGSGVRRGWKVMINQEVYHIEAVDDISKEFLVLMVSRKEVGV